MPDPSPYPKAAVPPGREPSASIRFMQFEFLRLDPRFHTLQSNEKLVARQEFLSAFESAQHEVAAIPYSLTGLRADCDVLLCRASEDLESIQDASRRLRGTGAGKYLAPAHDFLALAAPQDALSAGEPRLLFAHFTVGTREWQAMPRSKRQELTAEALRIAAKRPKVKMNILPLLGMESQKAIIAYETDDPQQYLELLRELEASPWNAYFQSGAPIFPCIRKDIRDLADALE